MEKYSHLKQAQEEDQKVYSKAIEKYGFRVYKYPSKDVYLLLNNVGDKSIAWVISKTGAVKYDSQVEAFDTFFGMVKVSQAMSFIRKSSYQTVNNQSRKKVAEAIKTAICYDNDAWIDNPENLIASASKDYWAVTKNGKYIARFFDEKDFPLEG